MNFTFRPAKHEDWKLTFKFKKAGLKTYVENIWGWDEQIQKKLHKENFAPQKTEIVQVDNNEIGYWTIKKTDSETFIENIILLTEYQNKGIGTKLIKLILEQSEKENKTTRLRVLKTNTRAKKLYENLGFKMISTSENHYEMVRDLKKRNDIIKN